MCWRLRSWPRSERPQILRSFQIPKCLRTVKMPGWIHCSTMPLSSGSKRHVSSNTGLLQEPATSPHSLLTRKKCLFMSKKDGEFLLFHFACFLVYNDTNAVSLLCASIKSYPMASISRSMNAG